MSIYRSLIAERIKFVVISIFKSKIELDEKGFVKKVKRDGFNMMTSADGVFVAGDVHDYHYKQAITAAGFGCQAALEMEKWLSDQK